MKTANIDFKAIYREIDIKESIKNIFKNIFLWSIAILVVVLFVAILFGYIKIPSRCHYDPRIQENVCYDPRS